METVEDSKVEAGNAPFQDTITDHNDSTHRHSPKTSTQNLRRLVKRIIGTNAMLLAILGAAFVIAAAQTPTNSIDQAQAAVAEAYKSKTLGTLDKQKLISGSLLVVIEHSLGGGKGQFVRKRFKTFAQLDGWLKKRETDEGAPFRQLMPLKKCAKGRCSYNFDGGILHNQLYLHDLYYSFRNGRLNVVKLHLLDGD